jgi:hypothetical protein
MKAKEAHFEFLLLEEEKKMVPVVVISKLVVGGIYQP